MNLVQCYAMLCSHIPAPRHGQTTHPCASWLTLQDAYTGVSYQTKLWMIDWGMIRFCIQGETSKVNKSSRGDYTTVAIHIQWVELLQPAEWGWLYMNVSNIHRQCIHAPASYQNLLPVMQGVHNLRRRIESWRLCVRSYRTPSCQFQSSEWSQYRASAASAPNNGTRMACWRHRIFGARMDHGSQWPGARHGHRHHWHHRHQHGLKMLGIPARDPKYCGSGESMYQIQATVAMEQEQMRLDMVATAAAGPI